MSKVFNMPLWMIVSFFTYIVILKGLILYLVWQWYKRRLLDRIIFIDKNNRWIEYPISLKGKQTIARKENEYVLQPDKGLLNSRGKALYIFSEGKPAPLKLDYNSHEWLDSKSIMGVLQNKYVQQIVKPTDKFVDLILILGAIGGFLAFIASVINILIATGVIKV